MSTAGLLQPVPARPLAERIAMVEDALARLRGWLEKNDYAGVEPHDALTSPLMKRTPLGRSRLLRLVALQGLRRLPLNPRPLLGIRPQINAISLGWALKGYAAIDDEPARERIEWALARLRELQIPGYSGACWGYYFDWQTRNGFKGANQPIIVSTSFIGLGLLELYEKYGRRDCLEWARSACNFVLKDLNRTSADGAPGFAFSYGPDDHEQVFNASLLGAQLLARVGAATGERELTGTARDAVRFALGCQNPDGSWPYGIGTGWSFVDNFHTGYVLISLKEYMESSGDHEPHDALGRGWAFYREHFFLNGCVPKYYHNRVLPVDAHAAAQSIVTCLTFNDGESASRVAEWTIERMQMRQGFFAYQVQGHYLNRIPYLRWSNAWMLYALARLRAELYIQPGR